MKSLFLDTTSAWRMLQTRTKPNCAGTACSQQPPILSPPCILLTKYHYFSFEDPRHRQTSKELKKKMEKDPTKKQDLLLYISKQQLRLSAATRSFVGPAALCVLDRCKSKDLRL